MADIAIPMIVVVGAGRAGLTFALCMARNMDIQPVALICRSQARRELLRRLPANLEVHAEPSPALSRAVVTIFATPDRALQQARDEWISSGAAHAEQVWLHLSGVTPASTLYAPEVGAAVASCHPLAALPDPLAAHLSDDHDQVARPLQGAFFAVDGPAADIATDIARLVGGRPVALSPDHRAAYHAAASVVANDWVALMAVGEELAQRSGLSAEQARWALLHLAKTSLQALESLPTSASLLDGLTGPVGRGDAETLAAHLAVMSDDAGAVHTALSRRLLDELSVAGRLSPEAVASLERVLRPDSDDDSLAT